MRVKVVTDGTKEGLVVTDVDKNEVIEHVDHLTFLKHDIPEADGSGSLPARLVLKREVDVEVVSYEQRPAPAAVPETPAQ